MNYCECGNEIGKKAVKCTDCVVKSQQNFQIRVANSERDKAKYPPLDEGVSNAMIAEFIKDKR